MFHRELDDSQLRYFGASLGALILGFAALAYWRWHSISVAVSLGVVSCVLTTIYYGMPTKRRSIYRVFAAITRPIQLVATMIILAFVYFVVLTPIGLMLRCFGHSVRQTNVQSPTFWKPTQPPAAPSRYFDTY